MWIPYPNKEWFQRQTLQKRVALLQQRLTLSDGTIVQLRLAKLLDAAALEAIQRQAYQRDDVWSRWAIVRTLCRHNSAVYLVATVANRPIAFIGMRVTQEVAHISHLAVIPAYQRQTIASVLLRETIRIAQKEHVQRLSLETPVTNQGAQRLYARFGFRSVRIKKAYYRLDGLDAVEMHYDL